MYTEHEALRAFFWFLCCEARFAFYSQHHRIIESETSSSSGEAATASHVLSFPSASEDKLHRCQACLVSRKRSKRTQDCLLEVPSLQEAADSYVS